MYQYTRVKDICKSYLIRIVIYVARVTLKLCVIQLIESLPLKPHLKRLRASNHRCKQCFVFIFDMDGRHVIIQMTSCPVQIRHSLI